MKKYEDCIKSRNASHRGPYHLRSLDISINRTLTYNEVYLESPGVKIVCQIKGPYTELAKGKRAIEISMQKSVATDYMNETCLAKLQSQVHNALKSNVLLGTLAAENLTVSLSYNLIECDCDPLSYLINAASVGLTSVGVMQKSLLAACSVAILEGKPLVDPTEEERKLSEATACVAYAADLNKIMHLAMNGPIGKIQAKDIAEMCIAGCKQYLEKIKLAITIV